MTLSVLEATMAGTSLSERIDIDALSPEQQEKLRQFKVQTRIANEKYLRAHPEVEIMLSHFLRDVFLKRPADIREFAAEHFTDPDLPQKVQAELHNIDK